MKRTIRLFALLVTVAVLSGCSTVPIIGRKQPPMPPAEYMAQQSALSYQQVLSESTLSDDQRQAAQLQRGGNRISAAVELFITTWRNEPAIFTGSSI